MTAAPRSAAADSTVHPLPGPSSHASLRPPAGMPGGHRATATRGLGALGRRLAVAAALGLGIGTAALGLPAAALAQNQAQPRLPMVELTAGIHLIRAEVADSFDTRMRGLMFRDRLGPNEGMLFVFQDRSDQCFWMKNTILPLSIAFIDDDGTIANIADMKPLDESSHCSARPVRFALEMEQGWFAKRGIKAGTRMSGDKVFRAGR